jgi:hypothetical protein
VENLALANQARKSKGKVRMNTDRESSSHVGTGKDLSKIKCFHCQKKGHYASQVLKQKQDATRCSYIDKGLSGSVCQEV